MKTCTRCKIEKPFEEFPKRSTKAGYRNQCKSCRNRDNRRTYKPNTRANTHLKATYGITLSDYDKMLKKQNGKCGNPSCSNKPENNKRLCIDHNHQTGEIRGLLCNGCNTAAGLAQDHPEVLRGLADYLEENGYYGIL